MAKDKSATAARAGHAEDGWALLEHLAAPAGSVLPPPRALVVFAHADDEVLALGGRLERLRESRLLTLTDGAPRNGEDARDHGFPSLDAYREARRAELLTALKDAGLEPAVAVPFPGATADQEASFHLVALARAVAKEIKAFSPDLVLTHPYEGGHPDHDACAFAVDAAVSLLRRGYGRGCDLPVVVEAPSYHSNGSGAMVTGSFLERSSEQRGPAIVVTLSAQEQENKCRRLACFPSQAETLAQFEVVQERFRVAPSYNFSERPHPGRLFYEQFSWGMTGDHFCKLAAAAQRELLSGERPEAAPAFGDGSSAP